MSRVRLHLLAPRAIRHAAYRRDAGSYAPHPRRFDAGGALPEAPDDIAARQTRDDDIFESLFQDINKLVSIGLPDPDANARLIALQMTYGGFITAWDPYVTSDHHVHPTQPDSDVTDGFEAKYRDLRAQFVALGGKPSADLPTDSIIDTQPLANAASSLASAAGSVAVVGVVGLALYLILR